jgi:pimeloyl-ACP methyl ester carboxylesterase
VTLLRALDACDAVSAPGAQVAAEGKGFTVLRIFDPPSSGGRAMLALDGQQVVLALRGSGADTRREVLANVQDDAFAVLVDPGDALGPRLPEAVRVHAGFLRHWLGFRDDVLGMLGSARDIVVTGFSLGGAVAVLAGVSLMDRNPSVIAFGAPRAGNGPFARWYRGRIECTRVVLPGDPVTLVPPFPYVHVPTLHRLGRDLPDLKPEHDRGEYRRALAQEVRPS